MESFQLVETPYAESNGKENSASGWRVLYFDAPTRGEQLRMLMAAAGQTFEDKRVDFPQGLAEFKHASLGDQSPLLFDQCPTVSSPDGVHISQVAAAMQFAGNRLGLAPTPAADTPEAIANADGRAMSLVLGSEELRNQVFYKLLIPMIVRTILAKKLGCCGSMIACCFCCGTFKTTGTGEHIQKFREKIVYFEAALRTNGGGDFFFGSTVCYADIALYDCISSILAMDCFDTDEELSKLPEVCASPTIPCPPHTSHSLVMHADPRFPGRCQGAPEITGLSLEPA
jgi:glutathione S-transferase